MGLLHAIVIIAGAVLVAVIRVWHTPYGVSCDATENTYRLSIFTFSTKSPYPFKATVRNETTLGTCTAVTVRACDNDVAGRGIVWYVARVILSALIFFLLVVRLDQTWDTLSTAETHSRVQGIRQFPQPETERCQIW